MTPPAEYDLRVISLGAGVQSSTLYRMAALGEIPGPMPSAAIFADTQAESPHVYEQVDALEAEHGGTIPIVRATAGSLLEMVNDALDPDSSRRFASVPFWVQNPNGSRGLGRRQCTREMKVAVVKKAIRGLLGLKPRERAAGRFRVESWIGISLDEAQRAKPARDSWIFHRWPFLYDVPMRRTDCLRWNEERGFPLPRRSACWFCPFGSESEYARMRESDPELFEKACQLDDALRSPTRRRETLVGDEYVLHSLIPLRELPSIDEVENRAQLDLFGHECEGMCGV